MKNLLLLLAATLLLFSCKNKDQFEITGTVSNPELEGKNVYLILTSQDIDPAGNLKVDTAKILSGKFEFKGIQKNPAVYFIHTDILESLQESLSTLLLIEPGKFTVTISDRITIGGGTSNDIYRQFNDSLIIVSEKMKDIQDKYITLPEDEQTIEAQEKASEEYMIYSGQFKSINLNYLRNNINDLLAQELLMQTFDQYNLDELKALLDNANETTKSKEPLITIAKQIESMSRVAIGQKFTDINLKNLNGKDTPLSTYAGQGKYVLIDFWASWCGPCVREMPTLVKAYKLYANKGFEIVGISLDSEAEAWQNAVKNLHITWPQLSDLQAWKSEAAKLYGVSSIPHTILLDKNGVIIEKDLRGKDLLNKLQEILK